jgi:hypothetical protein
VPEPGDPVHHHRLSCLGIETKDSGLPAAFITPLG